MNTTFPFFELLLATVLASSPGCDPTEPGRLDGGSASTEEADPLYERDPPGSNCSCDIECRAISDHRPICVFGICMLRPQFRHTCEGPTRTCPPAMQLREVYEYGGFVCYPECESYECEGDCDRFGACLDTEDTDFRCDPLCAAYCSEDSFW